MSLIRATVAEAARRLAASGVESPESDARLLLAHVLQVDPGELQLLDLRGREISAGEWDAYQDLLGRRQSREPLQHLTGTAYFRHVTLQVGPGVFTPRPETELLAGWAIDAARAAGERPVVVDLCTGSGAIAKAIKDELPDADVHAVELDEPALVWASRNLAGTGVDLRQGDAFTAFAELVGTVDVVVCNPPYIPLEAWESVAVEARDHDPHLALFSGDDGLDAMRLLEGHAALLLRPGGVVGAEHADVQGKSAPAVFAATGRWREVRDHQDLAGRARYLTARLAR
ncbi:peptide chain release factor N(5)-glutamine methyltransferase [Nocardioides jiangxiensis]|uniref:Release factor glutamine methyltransferase n=1 Tax=Nocardioides jiangxiensis TaxID=3064524 RepID=A0ABT9AY47_9ACTN|nr:peptide chain release factor N(5)-glutamine methyltransferase [Nocardioides sp. WY-20]MDO7867325.1 peptide chain release factor N(5)-glutamine methyltransferase [Nocardioides sp. WY-20]